MTGYGLYQTLNVGLPSVPFTKSTTENLHARIVAMCSRNDEKEKEAMFMLICEHARLNGEFSYSSEGNNTLPYLIQLDEKSNMVFDLYNLPDQLKAVLLKYTQLIDNQEEEIEHLQQTN